MFLREMFHSSRALMMKDIPPRRNKFMWFLAFVAAVVSVLGILNNPDPVPALSFAGLLVLCCVRIANHTGLK